MLLITYKDNAVADPGFFGIKIMSLCSVLNQTDKNVFMISIYWTL